MLQDTGLDQIKNISYQNMKRHKRSIPKLLSATPLKKYITHTAEGDLNI